MIYQRKKLLWTFVYREILLQWYSWNLNFLPYSITFQIWIQSCLESREYAPFYGLYGVFAAPYVNRCSLLHRNSGDTERRYHIRYYKTASCVHETDAKGELPLHVWYVTLRAVVMQGSLSGFFKHLSMAWCPTWMPGRNCQWLNATECCVWGMEFWGIRFRVWS